MNYRNYKISSLEEDLKYLGLQKFAEEMGLDEEGNLNEDKSNQLDEDEIDETDDDEDIDDLRERRLTRVGKMRKKGPHKKGFRRIKKAGGGYYFKKVTCKMLRAEKRRRKKTSYKKAVAKSHKKLRARGYGENVDTKINELQYIAGGDDGKFEQYVECLDNARKLAAKLIDEFEAMGENSFSKEIDDMILAGSLAESAMSNIYSMDTLSEDIEYQLEEGIDRIVNLLHEAMEKWEEISLKNEDETNEVDEDVDNDETLDNNDDDVPEIFQ